MQIYTRSNAVIGIFTIRQLRNGNRYLALTGHWADSLDKVLDSFLAAAISVITQNESATSSYEAINRFTRRSRCTLGRDYIV